MKILVLLFLISFSVYAEDSELLAEIDSLVTFDHTDLSAQYDISTYIPGTGTRKESVLMFRRDAENKFVILWVGPDSKKGKGYLKVDNSIWLYDPKDSRFTASNVRNRLSDNTIRISDLEPLRLQNDYSVTNTEENIQLGAYNTTLLSLEAVTETDFPKRNIWIDENNLIRKIEDYSLSGELLRTAVIAEYTALGNKYAIKKVIFVDHLKGAEIDGRFTNERTTIDISRHSDKELPQMIYTKSFLERNS